MLDGLLYHAAKVDTQETKGGVPKYRGGPAGFEEWKFKILGRVKSIRISHRDDDDNSEIDKKLVELSSKVLEALEGDARKIAIEIGHDALHEPAGVEFLLEKLEAAIPLGDRQDDTLDLFFHLGGRKTGPLSRQKGESMVSYIARRRRWITKLK